MNERPLVSVIIAVRNGERFLAQAIESVLAQTYRPIEIIVIDGHSTDRTPEIAKSYDQARHVLQQNSGIADGYNLGVDEARGPLIAFISHDDLWEPGKLTCQVKHMMQHPDLDYTVTKVSFFLEPGHAIPPGFKKELLDAPQVGRIMETLLVRKTLFDRIGRFNPDLPVAEDVDWYARAKDNDIPMAIIPEVLVRKRIHDTNASSNAALNNRQLLTVLRNSIRRQKTAATGNQGEST